MAVDVLVLPDGEVLADEVASLAVIRTVALFESMPNQDTARVRCGLSSPEMTHNI